MSNKVFSFVAAIALAAVAAFAQQQPSPAPDQPQSPPVQAQPAPDQSQPAPQAQPAPASDQQQVEPMDQTPVFRVNVVERTTKAVDYRDRGGQTQVDFKGTQLAPSVEGWAHVTGRAGRLAIDVNLHHLPAPRAVGRQYLSYVLWAITPEGRSVNLGEVIPDDKGNARLQVTSPLQVFGLIVTAEPYFAVTRPGDKMVAENIVRSDTQGWERTIDAKYEALQDDQYTAGMSPDQLPAGTDESTPLQMQEAENAIAIAKAAGAEQYASDTLAKAQENFAKAQDYLNRKQGNTPIGTVARAATQEAEDARLISLKKKQQEQAEAERQALEQKAQNAQSQAEAEAARAEESRLNAQREAEQRALAEQERQAAEQARQQAEQARLEAQQQAQQAEAQRQAALQQQQAAEGRAQQAEQQAQQMAEQRARLLQQLNTVLQTKDTPRGLIVNMSDVLFDLGQATLKEDAKLRLAKLSGIILTYPDLKLQINGYTDSTGTARGNQILSERRAGGVRDFLISQGLDENSVVAQGYGPADPVASNDTVAGRKQNRRVEIVLSGNAIGAAVDSAGAAH